MTPATMISLPFVPRGERRVEVAGPERRDWIVLGLVVPVGMIG